MSVYKKAFLQQAVQQGFTKEAATKLYRVKQAIDRLDNPDFAKGFGEYMKQAQVGQNTNPYAGMFTNIANAGKNFYNAGQTAVDTGVNNVMNTFNAMQNNIPQGQQANNQDTPGSASTGDPAPAATASVPNTKSVENVPPANKVPDAGTSPTTQYNDPYFDQLTSDTNISTSYGSSAPKPVETPVTPSPAPPVQTEAPKPQPPSAPTAVVQPAPQVAPSQQAVPAPQHKPATQPQPQASQPYRTPTQADFLNMTPEQRQQAIATHKRMLDARSTYRQAFMPQSNRTGIIRGGKEVSRDDLYNTSLQELQNRQPDRAPSRPALITPQERQQLSGIRQNDPARYNDLIGRNRIAGEDYSAIDNETDINKLRQMNADLTYNLGLARGTSQFGELQNQAIRRAHAISQRLKALGAREYQDYR